MINPKILLQHMKINLLTNVRQPAFIIPTLVIPALIYIFYGTSVNDKEAVAASFAAFAVFGVVFFQFGVSATLDRASAWSEFERTLPSAVWVTLLSKILVSLLFSLCAASVVLLCAFLLNDFYLDNESLIRLYLSLIIGAIPFALMGSAIGYWLNPRSAMPVANLIYLVFSFLGGFWLPPQAMSEPIRNIASYMPTFHWGMLIWQPIYKYNFPYISLSVLVFSTLVFFSLAYLGYRRSRY